MGRVCLAGARVLAVEGILNGTTNYILSRMQAEGCPHEVALRDAQAQGIAETDPRLDVEGRDSGRSSPQVLAPRSSKDLINAAM